MSAAAWAVTWERDGVRYLIDVDEAFEAYRLAVAIAESGRAAVRITPCEVDIPADAAERIRQRVVDRLRAAGGLP